MTTETERPWRFTIEFDEFKAYDNGYTVEELLELVNKAAMLRDLKRVDSNTWQASSKEREFPTICGTLNALSRKKLILNTVSKWTVFDDEDPQGSDYLESIARFPFATLC